MATLKYRDSNGNFKTFAALSGPAGIGVAKIEQTQTSNAANGNNVWTMTLTDGRIADFIVKNGAQGPKGDKGDPGGITDVAASSTKGYITVTKADGSTKQVAVGAAGDFLPLTGGVLTGHLTLNNGYIYINDDSWPQLGFSTSTGINRGLIYYGGGTSAIGNLTLRNYIDDTGSNYKEAYLGVDGGWYANTVHGAVWNDYAEYRESDCTEPGRVVYEVGNDTLSMTNKRMIPACSIVSDTFGFAIGQTTKCQTPLAQAGRVLAYPFEDRNSYKPGDAVCSGPNGTVSKMTDDEKMKHPECIIGYISCVPTYETWGEKDTKVDGRVWVRIA